LQVKNRNILPNIDWLTILLFFTLVVFGLLSINAVNHMKAMKQLISVLAGLPLIFIALSLSQSFYERFAGIFYLLTILLLIGLFFFGKNINGATSWYSLGSFSLQPTEFAKIGTALMIANLLNTPKLEINRPITLMRVLSYWALPLLLIKMQPDDGSVLVFSGFLVGLFVHRVWMVKPILIIGLTFIILFIIGISFSNLVVFFKANELLFSMLIFSVFLFIFTLMRFIFYIKKFSIYLLSCLGVFICFGIIFTSHIIFNSLKPHQKDRIDILFLDDTNKKTRNEKNGYNLYTSKSAIAAGEFYGKGYMKSDMARGNIVPEQETDYIFTIIGEERGFVGSTLFIIIYGIFLMRLFWLAHRQKIIFSSYFGYTIASIFLIHFTLNIAMVMGLFPTIGIPLPFISYGGSSLWGFSLMVFIMIRLDAERKQILR